MRQIIVNKIKCVKCGDIIESKQRHDFVRCSCRAVAVDGGHDYQRLIGEPEDYDTSYSVYGEEIRIDSIKVFIN